MNSNSVFFMCFFNSLFVEYFGLIQANGTAFNSLTELWNCMANAGNANDIKGKLYSQRHQKKHLNCIKNVQPFAMFCALKLWRKKFQQNITCSSTRTNCNVLILAGIIDKRCNFRCFLFQLNWYGGYFLTQKRLSVKINSNLLLLLLKMKLKLKLNCV